MENITTWEKYLDKFEEVLAQETPQPPYDDPMYLDYFKLNRSRQRRWLKTAEINADLTQIIKSIDKKQTWYLITEPWCGDAAHNVPFIYKMTELNPNIELKIVWRDTAPYMIEDYLTNGGKSIPKLVIRDENEKDLHVWGPRPAECQPFTNNSKQKMLTSKNKKSNCKIGITKTKAKVYKKNLLKC